MTSLAGGIRKGVLKYGRTVRLLCSSSVPNNPNSLNDRHVSSSSKLRKILTESTTIIQDGTSIGELPILIRRATRDTYPFTSHSYSGNKICPETEFDMTFKDMLENCDSVSDVFNLLEVPSDKVQGHCAVYALQRLHVLMSLNTDWRQIHSFIRKAVIGELYHIVERDIRLLSNFSLVTLVDCYFAAEGFSATCSEALQREISHRLVESLFSVEELLSLIYSLRTGIRNTKSSFSSSHHSHNGSGQNLDKKPSFFKDTLSENASVYLSVEHSKNSDDSANLSNMAFQREEVKSYQELLQNVWVHLASRCHDMDENTIPWTMQLLPSNKKMFIPLLDKALTDYWPLLSAETAAMCLDNLVRLRTHNSSMMTKLAQYAFVNVHQMTPAVLLSYLHAFLHFSVTDRNFIKVMQKCISKSGLDTPTDILALCVEYLRSCKYVSPIIMDVTADHFTRHWKSYNPLEIYAVLRNFGELRYLPPDSSNFFEAIHSCLHKRFNVMEETRLLEVMASLTFVGPLPLSLYKRIISEYFFNKVGALTNPNKARALMWLKVIKHAMVMMSNETRDEQRDWVLKGKKKWDIFIYQVFLINDIRRIITQIDTHFPWMPSFVQNITDSERHAIHSVRDSLTELFGPLHYHVIPYYRCCALYLDAKGVPIKMSTECEKGHIRPEETPVKRLVILLRSESQFTSNTKQLLGPHQQRLDQLVKLGYIPLEIRSADFLFRSGTGVIQSRLAKFVNFEHPVVKALGELQALQEEEGKTFRNYLEDEEQEGQKEEAEIPEDVLRDLMEALRQIDKEASILPPTTKKR